MFRFATTLLTALIAAFPLECAGKDLVLLAKPPVYQPGEQAEGYLDTMGMRLRMLQQAIRAPDARTLVSITLINPGGQIVMRGTYSPLDWGAKTKDRNAVETIATTCSQKDLFPIVAGKVYECSSTEKVGQSTINVRTKLEFDLTTLDQFGNIASICMKNTRDSGDSVITGRACMSPDGKWIRAAQILQVLRRQGI